MNVALPLLQRKCVGPTRTERDKFLQVHRFPYPTRNYEISFLGIAITTLRLQVSGAFFRQRYFWQPSLTFPHLIQK
jgi:hypothetical protein